MANQEKVEVTSYNQQGGITAQTVIINNISAMPQPMLTVNAKESYLHKLEDGKYHSYIQFSLNSPYALGNLYVEVRAKSIEDMECMPRRTGGWEEGLHYKTDGFVVSNMQNAYGTYDLIIVTSQPDHITVIYDIG